MAGSGCATGLTGSPNHVENDFANIEGGVVSTAGGEVDYWVQYGTTTAYGSQTTPDTVSVAQNAPTSVTVVVSGLQRATLYHYRFCAEDDDQPDGPGCGEDRTFTTQSFACGETVTSDVRTDMLCFSKPGLVVGADGVDVNLSGHSLDGGTTGFPNGPTGIDNSGGFDDVTVRNGRLPNWGDAISATDASRNRILSVDATGKTTAIRLTRGDHNEVRRSQLAGGLWALRATDSANLVVANSVVDATPGTGILITNGSTARVARNRVERLSVPSSPTAGIQVDGSAGGRIVENVVTGPWTFGGIWARLTSGIVRDNEVSGGAFSSGTQGPSDGDGLYLVNSEGSLAVRGNFAHDNAGDGIEMSGTSAQDNTANDNGDFGIDAGAGTVDLGGNSAHGNGNPLQCRTVFCQ